MTSALLMAFWISIENYWKEFRTRKKFEISCRQQVIVENLPDKVGGKSRSQVLKNRWFWSNGENNFITERGKKVYADVLCLTSGCASFEAHAGAATLSPPPCFPVASPSPSWNITVGQSWEFLYLSLIICLNLEEKVACKTHENIKEDKAIKIEEEVAGQSDMTRASNILWIMFFFRPPLPCNLFNALLSMAKVLQEDKCFPLFFTSDSVSGPAGNSGGHWIQPPLTTQKVRSILLRKPVAGQVLLWTIPDLPRLKDSKSQIANWKQQ